VGLLGPKRAGKTPLLCHRGLFLPIRRVLFDDEISQCVPCTYGHASMASAIPQEASVFRKLTVEENIWLCSKSSRFLHERREKAEKLIDQLGLSIYDKIRDMPCRRRAAAG